MQEGQAPAAPADETAVWAPMLDPCQHCNPQGPHLLRIHGAAGPHLGRQAPRAGGEIRRLPVTIRAARSGDRLA
eukprot:8707259-Pyramimonas_sp.AAC.1